MERGCAGNAHSRQGFSQGFRRARVFAAVVWLAVAGSPAVAQPAEGPSTCPDLSPGPSRTVARIIDGETVTLDDGAELRLIGALAPRAIDAGAEAGTWPAEAKAREGLTALVLGKSVELGFGGDRADRYGRLLAHAFLVEGDRRHWVQAQMLERGLARAYALPGHRACADALLSAERTARSSALGLWAEAAYQVRRADNPGELLRYRATFQLVEGRVARVAQARGTIYLNFDRNWRQAFSASLKREDSRQLLGTHAGNPAGLEGRDVQLRGWIEQRGGAPVIDLSSAGHVEVVGDGDAERRATRSR
jgi:endonuclease YncB( thermonuclease family)